MTAKSIANANKKLFFLIIIDVNYSTKTKAGYDVAYVVQNGYKVVSLNSVNNIHSFIHYLESNFKPRPKLTFIMAFDHDEAGEKAGKELEKFFQDYNSSHKRQYQYAFCDYPEHYHDINDYWVSRVYESQNGTE